MVYTPPGLDKVDFSLIPYSAPRLDKVDFVFGTLSWTDDFEADGMMKLVNKQADGLHLSEGYCLNFNGSGEVRISDLSRYTSRTADVTGNHSAESGLEPLATNDIDPESNSGIRGNSGERYAIFPSHGNAWGGGSQSGSGLSVGTNRVEVVEHGNGFIPIVAGATGTFTGRCALSYMYDGGVPKIFKDAELLRSGLVSGRPVHPTVGLGLSPSIAQYGGFVGRAYYLYVWDHPRTPEQLLADAYRIPKPDEQGLLFAWLLDDGSGATVTDWSSNEFHGSMSPGPTWQPGLRRAGVRIVEVDLSAIGAAQSSQISWIATEPEGTGVTIETNLSLDGGETWLGWKVCTNNGEIPDLISGFSLANARLKIWEHLHTMDPAVEPVLHEIKVIVTSGGPINTPPIAEAGEDRVVVIGERVDLHGTGSHDPEEADLTFAWCLVVRPSGSQAMLINPFTPTPHFFPDVAGEYVAQLVVNDGLFDSEPDTVLITALPAENLAEIILDKPVRVENRAEILLVRPSRAENRAYISLVTWPPHRNFAFIEIDQPVRAENFARIELLTKIFGDAEPPPAGVWRMVESGSGLWRPVERGSESPWRRL